MDHNQGGGVEMAYLRVLTGYVTTVHQIVLAISNLLSTYVTV
jgi:hypothetical protein